MPDRPAPATPDETGIEDRGRHALLSVVVPCYNEEAVVEHCAEQLREVLDRLELRWEIVFVDDGSRDRTADKLRALTAKEPRYRALILSRNFGQPTAVFAGLDHCLGDAAVVTDADLQDPPAVIEEMVAAWRAGNDIVAGERRVRHGESAWRRGATSLFSALMDRLSGQPLSKSEGDFRLMDRKVVDAVCRMRERPQLIRATSGWTGFRVATVPFDRAERHAGSTNYSKRRLLALGIDTLLAFSNRPLRIAGWLSAAVLAAALAGLLFSIGTRFATGAWPGGWLLLLFANLFLVGVQLAVLALIGAYLGRIYDEVKGRPPYIVAQHLNSPQERPAATRRSERTGRT